MSFGNHLNLIITSKQDRSVLLQNIYSSKINPRSLKVSSKTSLAMIGE